MYKKRSLTFSTYTYIPSIIASIAICFNIYPDITGVWQSSSVELFGIKLSEAFGYANGIIPLALFLGLAIKLIQISAESNTISLFTVLFDIIALAVPALLIYNEYVERGIGLTAPFITFGIFGLFALLSLISDLVSIGLDG